MIDINIVREKPEIIKNSLENRQMDPSVVDQLAELDKKWRAILTKAEVLKAERNKVSKQISKIKDKSDNCLLYTSDACLLYTSPSPRDRS